MSRTERLRLATVTGPVTRLGWTARAACKDDAGLMFGPDDEAAEAQAAREAKAVKVCGPCPVRLRCALWALRTGTAYGVFGGLSEKERAGMKRNGERKAVA